MMYLSIIDKIREVMALLPNVRSNKKNCQKLCTKLCSLLDALTSLAHNKILISERVSIELDDLVEDILKFVEKSTSKSLFSALYKSKLLAEYNALDLALTELLLAEPKLLQDTRHDVACPEVSAPVTVRQNSGSGAGDPALIMRWILQNTAISRSKAQSYANHLVQYGVSTISSLISAMELQSDVLSVCEVDAADQTLLVTALRHYQGTPQASPRYDENTASPDMIYVAEELHAELKRSLRDENLHHVVNTIRAISQACSGKVIMMSIFGQLGTCAAISNYLFTSHSSSSVCEAALECICHLTRHGPSRDTSHDANIMVFGQSGACDAIIAAMDAHSRVYNVLFWGAHAILNLTVNANNNNLFGKAGACVTISTQLQQQKHTTQTEDSVSHYIWGALINLALNSDNNALLFEAGACRAVVDVWKNHRQNPNVALWGCMAVQNLSLNSKNNAELGELGVCRLVTYSIRHYDDSNLLTQAILAVQNLVSNAQNNIELGKLGMCEYIIRTFAIDDVPKCQRYCVAIMNLSFKNAENKLRFGRNACALLLQVLSHYANDAIIVEASLGAVANLVDDACTENIIHCGDLGMCEVLLTIMRLYIDDEIMCELSCWIVMSLGHYLPNAIVLGAGGVGELISRILRTSLGLETVVDMACFALEVLTLNKDICFRLVRTNTAEMMIKALQMHKHSERIVLHCCNAIHTMCNSELCARSFQALSAYGVVSSAIKCHFANETIQRVGFEVLKVLSSGPSTNGEIHPLTSDDVTALDMATDPIVALNALRLAVYYQNEAYTLASLKCTKRLAANSSSTQKMLFAQGVCEYIAYLFYPSMSSSEGCKYLMEAIAVLARHGAGKDTSCPELISQFGEHGLCRGTTMALKKTAADADCALSALRAITYLCCDKNIIRFGAAGCCEVVIETLALHSTDRVLAQQAWSAMINLVLEEVNCTRSVNACEHLVNAFKLWNVYADCMEWLLLACHNLTSAECNRDRLASLGISTLLCSAIKDYSDVECIARYGCMTVQRLAQSPATVALMGAAGMCEALVMLLHVYVTNEPVVEEILSALVALASSEHCDKFVKAGVCNVLPKIMSRYAVENEEVAEYSAALVYYLCLHTQAAAEFDIKTFEVITRILTTHCTYEIVDNCCSAILYLCINNESNFGEFKKMDAYSAMMAGVDGIATEHYISETCRRALVLFEPSNDSFAAATMSAVSSASSSPKARKMTPVHRWESVDSVKDAVDVEAAQQLQCFCDAMIARDNNEMLARLTRIRRLASKERHRALMRVPPTIQILFSALSNETFPVEMLSLLLEVLVLLLQSISTSQYEAMMGKLNILPAVQQVLKMHYDNKDVTRFACDGILQLLRLDVALSCDTLLICDIAMHFMNDCDVLNGVLKLLKSVMSKHQGSACDINMLVCLLRRSELNEETLLLLLSVVRMLAESGALFTNPDVISALMAALQIYTPHARPSEAILTSLSYGLNCCSSTEIPVVAVDDFDTLMCVIREHDGSSPICSVGWACISVLLLHQPLNRERYIAAHGAVLLKIAFENWAVDEIVLQHILQICICVDQSTELEFVTPEILADILRYYTSDAAIAKASQGQGNNNTILTLVLRYMVMMCDKHDANRIIFGSANCCENTTAAMTLILKSEMVVISACNAIRALAMDPTNKAKFTSIGTFAVILRILQKNYTSFDIALHGLLALEAVPDFDQIHIVYDVVQKVIAIHIQTDMTRLCLSVMGLFSTYSMEKMEHSNSPSNKNHFLPPFAIEFAAQSLRSTDHPMIVEHALVILLHAVRITHDLNDLPITSSNLFNAIVNRFELSVLPSLNLLRCIVSSDVSVGEELCSLNVNNILFALGKPNAEVVLSALQLIILFCCNSRSRLEISQGGIVTEALAATMKHREHAQIAENMLMLLLVCHDEMPVAPELYEDLSNHAITNRNIAGIWLDLLLLGKNEATLRLVRDVAAVIQAHVTCESIAEKVSQFLIGCATSTVGFVIMSQESEVVVTCVLQALEHIHNECVAENCIHVLLMVIEHDQTKHLIATANSTSPLTPLLLKVLQAHSAHKSIVKNALKLFDQGISCAGIDASLFPLLVHAHFLQMQLLQPLLSLMLRRGGSDYIPTLMHDLLQSLSVHIADGSMVILLCHVIKQYAANEQNVSDLMRNNAGAQLLRLLSVHLHRADVLIAVCDAVTAFTADDAHCAQLGADGFCGVMYETCQDLINGTSEHADNTLLKMSVVQLLSLLSCVDENKYRLEAVGICSHIAGILNWRYTSPEILSTALRFVINMASSVGAAKEQLGAAGISDLLEHILVENELDMEATKLSLWAIMNLAIADENKTLLGTATICGCIVSAMKMHKMDVAEVALGAVINLCDHHDANKIVLASCYQCIVDILRGTEDDHVAAMCEMAIVNLTENSPENRSAFNTQELVDLLFNQLQQRGEVAEVVEQSSWALQILSEEGSLLSLDQVTFVVKLLYRNRKNNRVIDHLSGLLYVSLDVTQLPASLLLRLCTVLPDVLMAQSCGEVAVEHLSSIVQMLIVMDSSTFDHKSLQILLLTMLMSHYDSDAIVLRCIASLRTSFRRLSPSEDLEPFCKAVLKAMRTHFLVEAVVLQCCDILIDMSIWMKDCAVVMARYGACETATAALETHISGTAMSSVCDLICILCDSTANCYMLGTAGACDTLIDGLNHHATMTPVVKEKCILAIMGLLRHEGNRISCRSDSKLMVLLLQCLEIGAGTAIEAIALLTENYTTVVTLSSHDVMTVCRAAQQFNDARIIPLLDYCAQNMAFQCDDALAILREIQEQLRRLEKRHTELSINVCAALSRLAYSLAAECHDNAEIQQLIRLLSVSEVN